MLGSGGLMDPGCLWPQLVKWGLMALPSPQRERRGCCCLVLVFLDGVWAHEADTGLGKLFLSLHSPHNLRG